MKHLIIASTLFLSTAYAINQGSGYSPNNGGSAPGTFTSKAGMGDGTSDSTTTGTQVIPSGASTSENVTSPSGMTNSSGVGTDQMNTSPNPAPASEEEATQNTTLTTDRVYQTGPYDKDGNYSPEIQAEEDAMDYSTTPSTRTQDENDIEK